MVSLRRLTIRLRKVPSFVWRLTIFAVLIMVSAAAWWYPVSHRWLAVQLGISLTPPQAIAADTSTNELADRVSVLEQKVSEDEQQVTDDKASMTSLQADFQTATAQVEASNTELQKQTAEIQALLKEIGSTSSSSSSDSSSPVDSSSPIPTTGKVSLNTGTAAQLDTLPGIGTTYAQRIIDYRNAHGPFTSIDDLTNVSGIGPATLEKIRDLVEL